VPWYFESSSWIGTAQTRAGCPQGAKVRVTQEELWTTALLANYYGGKGISVFNFIYTRPCKRVACAALVCLLVSLPRQFGLVPAPLFMELLTPLLAADADYDLPCEFELNKPYSEPLFIALNRTKDLGFLKSSANQLYRLGRTREGVGQISLQSGKAAPSYRIVVVAPTGGGKYLSASSVFAIGTLD
jgi:hypothetical protein